MELDPARCYQAVLSRDPRFDGRFFIGVRTTGIYCRPVCPVKPAKRENVEFYPCAAAAEAAGFRPCLRCRPEASPGTPAWLGSSAVVSRGLRLIADGALDEGGIEQLAGRLGIGGRQLRRLFAMHLGVSPAEVARTRRAHFARRLIDETTLSPTRIAFASGFSSIRQFNHTIRATFGAPPTVLRRRRDRRGPIDAGGTLSVRLPYRPPLNWRALLEFLRPRATPGVELVDAGTYRRTIAVKGAEGMIEVRPGPPVAGRPAPLLMMVHLPECGDLLGVVERVRRVFDLGADPLQITGQLRCSQLARPIARLPGLRVPGAWDAFELAVRAILGQQVTVRGATTLAGRLVQRFGIAIRPTDGLGRFDGLTHRFPPPEGLADADLTVIGIPRARAETIRALAVAVCTGSLILDAANGLEDAVNRLRAIPGIGEWTAQYIAMRAYGEPDAFPAGDLGLRHALANGSGTVSAAELARRAEAWRPWRAYAAMYLWMGMSHARLGERAA